jgi:hypothetical protein
MLMMTMPSASLDDVVLSHASRIPFSLRRSVEIIVTSKNILIIFELLFYRSNSLLWID